MITFKIAVVGHFFYVEQARMVAESLRNIPQDFDLYASVSRENLGAVQRLLAEALPGQKTVLRAVVNRGFDIAPFVCEFRDVYPAYDLVLKVHTKKSSHTFCLKEWGDYLLKNLAGSPETVSAILKMFEDDKNLGLVYPEMIDLFKRELSKDPWQGNWELCADLGARLGLRIEKDRAPDFPAGSMFWFRPKALEVLLKQEFTPEDFPDGKYFHRNGTLAHAIERLFVRVADKQGFTAREVRFHPFKGVRDGTLRGRLQNAACCEWERLLHFLGRNR
ncbi:MAG TPA: rhamnan synthesis F family protein [Candidatus Omnitrophota bacterium]|nr:rhamnan synthesis F family protein [Candidatus Omnitrophota bacterium]HPS36807.1 rhamnan synthesis F family protein [Candidatus Omnitrophota bacterium]